MAVDPGGPAVRDPLREQHRRVLRQAHRRHVLHELLRRHRLLDLHPHRPPARRRVERAEAADRRQRHLAVQPLGQAPTPLPLRRIHPPGQRKRHLPHPDRLAVERPAPPVALPRPAVRRHQPVSRTPH
ncbi:hypothetical protein SGPA1_10002 [Streptomyces misionensis JCM 4497]